MQCPRCYSAQAINAGILLPWTEARLTAARMSTQAGTDCRAPLLRVFISSHPAPPRPAPRPSRSPAPLHRSSGQLPMIPHHRRSPVCAIRERDKCRLPSRALSSSPPRYAVPNAVVWHSHTRTRPWWPAHIVARRAWISKRPKRCDLHVAVQCCAQYKCLYRRNTCAPSTWQGSGRLALLQVRATLFSPHIKTRCMQV